MPRKMTGRLVALSASAVATIYVTGLLSTRAAAQSLATGSADDVTASPALTSSATNPVGTALVVGASATATPVATSTTAASTSSYADGAYSGTATSRFGSVTVSVTTAGGTITNVQITKVTTTFPVSQIASLPAQVVQNQTANVNAVTGATYSTQAFKQAVQQALAQARAANSTQTAG